MTSMPGRPTDIDKIDAEQPLEPATPKETPEEGRFASYMQKEETPPGSTSKVTGPSPMELAAQGKLAPGKPPTMQDIQTQMSSVSSSLGDIKNQLHTPGLKLKQSQKYLMRNKLDSANQYIRGAASKMGVDVGEPPDTKGMKNPITKFLAMVTDGQNQLNSAAQQLNNLNSSGQSISAGELLLVQVKLQKASQELEYTSVLLGKAVDIIKQLFNIQI